MGEPLHWRPSASMDMLHQRAQMMATIRQFFSHKSYLEVETPIMARCGVTDVYLRNIEATFRDRVYALQTSPEYHMKRLLASGSGPIFQLARVFRDDELGRWHNPEFTLLEWYQLGVNHLDLLAEVDELLQLLLGCPPLAIRTYEEVFQSICGINPFETHRKQLRDCVARFDLAGVIEDTEQDLDQYLFLLMSHVVEPGLASELMPTAVIDFPISQASLAQIHGGRAARFEVYYRGVELANGFHELTDPQLQAARFDSDNHSRELKGIKAAEVDALLLQALQHGLPACSGVALGVDRTLALAAQTADIASCLAFDFSRA